MSTLTGRTALVTGATSGIGRAVAERLAGEGAHVILSGRDEGRGEQVVAAIHSSGGSARFVPADLAQLDDVKRLAAESGLADILVNNAGVAPLGATSEIGEDAFDLAFDVNVKASFFLTAAIAPKAAIELLTKAWTDEYGPGGIRVNAGAGADPHSRNRADGSGARPAGRDTSGATRRERRADRIGRRVPRVRSGELRLRSRGARRRRQGRRLMARTGQAGRPIVVRPAGSVPGDLASTILTQRKEQTWL